MKTGRGQSRDTGESLVTPTFTWRNKDQQTNTGMNRGQVVCVCVCWEEAGVLLGGSFCGRVLALEWAGSTCPSAPG